MSNSDNPGIGAAFQSKVNDWFNIIYGPTFEEEVKIPIGARWKGSCIIHGSIIDVLM